jgi:hypothetical protein
MKIRRRLLKKMRNSLKKIYISKAEIKYTNNNTMITIYVVDKEKDILKRRYIVTKKIINENMYDNFFSIYKLNIITLHSLLNRLKTNYFYTKSIINKRNYLNYKLKFFYKLKLLKNLYIKKILTIMIIKY